MEMTACPSQTVHPAITPADSTQSNWPTTDRRVRKTFGIPREHACFAITRRPIATNQPGKPTFTISNRSCRASAPLTAEFGFSTSSLSPRWRNILRPRLPGTMQDSWLGAGTGASRGSVSVVRKEANRSENICEFVSSLWERVRVWAACWSPSPDQHSIGARCGEIPHAHFRFFSATCPTIRAASSQCSSVYFSQKLAQRIQVWTNFHARGHVSGP